MIGQIVNERLALAPSERRAGSDQFYTSPDVVAPVHGNAF